ncbi:MAG: hypothetical protein M1826_007342 [Phylliscum demangeonii]|nr:MAG: hypothetical protein M1826_007342 [Phylliscum demangeonii]
MAEVDEDPSFEGVEVSVESTCTVEDGTKTSTYQSEIFTLVVGSKPAVFTAHHEVLIKSPFFRAACDGSWREAALRSIVLKDDDPGLITLMLDYLYAEEYEPRIVTEDKRESLSHRSDDEEIRVTELSLQARLYCVAEKYRLQGLKLLAIRKMGLLVPIPLESLIEIAEEAYGKLPASGYKFRNFVRNQASKLGIAHAAKDPWLLEKIRNGGTLAEDLFRALVRLHEGKPSRS